MIPDVPHVVLELDVDCRRMKINPLPGLIEETAPVSNVTL
jgi:hypothetical protein